MRAVLATGLAAALALPVLAEDGPKMPETPISAEDPCGASDYQHLIGQPGDTARALEFDRPVRVIPRGAAVTMDFRQTRINFELDDAGNVARIYCG